MGVFSIFQAGCQGARKAAVQQCWRIRYQEHVEDCLIFSLYDQYQKMSILFRAIVEGSLSSIVPVGSTNRTYILYESTADSKHNFNVSYLPTCICIYVYR